MRFDTFLFAYLSTFSHFSPVVSQGRRCKDIPVRKEGMSDLFNFGCTVAKGTLKLILQNICEGEPCPFGTGSNNVCTNGNCIDRSGGGKTRVITRPFLVPQRPEVRRPSGDRERQKTTQRPKSARPLRGAGKLQVQILRAELPDSDVGFAAEPDAYAVICVHRGSKREEIDSPLLERDGCTCRTRQIEDSNNPEWNHVCDQWDVNKYAHNSTIITVEVYDEDVTTDDFMGAYDISVLQIIKQGKHGKELDLDLLGPYPSKITINSTWTAIRK